MAGSMHLGAPDPANLICALLRGEDVACPDETGFRESLLSSVRYHGVAALLIGLPMAGRFPQGIREALRREAVAQAMWELRHRQLIVELLARLAQSGMAPIILKGTALAYCLYDSPASRSRGDTDLFVDMGSLDRCRRVLADCGFQREFAIPGLLVFNEESWSLEGHTIDLHRKISNSAVLARLFAHDELLAASRPLPALSPDARGPGDVHSLLIACMHRATHRNVPYYVDGIAHYGGDRLIWLCDIQLLAQQLGEREWEVLVSMAKAKGLAVICLQALSAAQSSLGASVPASVLVDLAQAGEAGQPDLYLSTGRIRQAWMDFLSNEGAAKRAAYLAETLFPPKHYMLAKYTGTAIPLPLLYLRRAFAGVFARLTRTESGWKA